MSMNIIVSASRWRPHLEKGQIDYARRPARLMAMETEGVARFLAPSSWAGRMEWLENAVIDGLGAAAGDIRGMRLKVVDARQLVSHVAMDLTAKIADVLDRLDQLSPLPLDENALRIFRAAADPGRIEMTRLQWRTLAAEREVLGPGCSGFGMLRDCMVAMAAIDAEERRQRAARRRAGGVA